MIMEKDTCHECKTTKDLNHTISCGHLYCTQCFTHLIFINHINNFTDCELIKIKCKCERDGSISMNLPQIYDILKKNIIINSNERVQEHCLIHPTESKGYYCRTCGFSICITCIQSKSHQDHITVLNDDYAKKLQSFLSTLPIQYQQVDDFIKHFDTIQSNFKLNIEDCLNKSLNNIDEIIQNLNSLKAVYKKIIKARLERGVLILKILKQFYSEYYYSFQHKEEEKSITILKYLKNIKHEIKTIQVYQKNDLEKKLIAIKEMTDEMKQSPQDVLDIQFEYKRLNLAFIEERKLIGHKDKVYTIIQLKDGRLCSGSEDYTIRFWSENQGEFYNTYTIDEFTGQVIGLIQLKDDRIISSSNDGNTNKVWAYKASINKYVCDLTLAEHQDTVTSFTQLTNSSNSSGNDLLITTSKDKTIKIWSILEKTFKCMQTLTDHQLPVYTSCQISNERFATGGDDSTIIIWKKNESQLYCATMVLKGHDKRVRSIVELHSGDLCSGGDDFYLRMWKKNKEGGFNCVKSTMKHHFAITSVIQMNDGRVVTASKDKTVRIWDYSVNAGWGVQEVLKNHRHIVFGVVQMKDGRIASAGGDHQIIIWKSGIMDE